MRSSVGHETMPLKRSLSSGRAGQNGRWALLALVCLIFVGLLWLAPVEEGDEEFRKTEDWSDEVERQLGDVDAKRGVSKLSGSETAVWAGEDGLPDSTSSHKRHGGRRREAIADEDEEERTDDGDKATGEVEDSELCDRTNYPAAWELKSDQLTILINGFAEARLPLLQKHVRMYSMIPIVNSIYILWSNISTPAELLEEANFESLGAPIYLVRQKSTSLNDRFLPRSYIKTRAVMICDDDITVDPKSLTFALDVWREEQGRIVGFFPRSHAYELDSKSWMYVKQQGKYSIMLTKLMILATEYLYLYTCEIPKGVKEYVDDGMNCEDIAMNFVVSSHSGKGPLLVEGKPRDWGDTRNTDDEELSAGALSGRGGHRKNRGDCITAFQKFWNGMELKFSYTKAVSQLEEQVYCDKFGYLIDCDKQVTSKREARRYAGEHVVSYTHRYAYATFLPSDSHLNLSLLLAQSLRSSGTVHDLVLLVDPSCTVIRKNHVIYEHYDEVVMLQTPQGLDFKNQLGKLNAWLLTDYHKVVYLEIDSLVLANLDHLFMLSEPAAAPRVFMPGKFSTGLLVLKPSNATYNQLLKSLSRVRMLTGRRRQYLLNSHFSGWFQMPVENRLPARYNTPVVFSKQLRVPIWFDVNRAFELLGPPMVLRYGNSRISSRHVDPSYGIVNSWCVSRFRLFEALQDNDFHPMDEENMTFFSWMPVEKWNASDMTWPPKPPVNPTSITFSVEKSELREAFVTVLWKEETLSLAGWAESFYHHHPVRSGRKMILLVSSFVDPEYYAEYRSYFDEIRVVSRVLSNGRTAHGSFTLLHLWNQTDYDKLVYVASTSLFVDNCNSLLDHNPFAAVPSIFPPDSFSTEVMVIQPDEQTFSILQKKLSTYDYPSQPVEQFLNGHYNDWYHRSALHRISPYYSVSMAFDSHLRNSPLPWKVLSFNLDWLPNEEANVTRLWKRTVCELKSTARSPNLVSPFCEASFAELV
ncbi:glycogenin [Marchantia polymorpha subsp. ruderalis]|uniref:Glycosyl transferase 64 domain-containing protein n=1 Tax=Marchantia polymorpha TaxID=3197 RepID=A0A2R6XAZ0_MARPO|nr:hypothetical protein MARPO_0026s0119 [Marchantia polymorpha]BBN02073.1 hypothetical protein Mp_2g12520 [Marchantia polymorpha subsp. ruderalis]|eukprot:PTQ43248.1 hypothetical protein MARPO_0026s0119 [Marchantia polymorpha]